MLSPLEEKYASKEVERLLERWKTDNKKTLAKALIVLPQAINRAIPCDIIKEACSMLQSYEIREIESVGFRCANIAEQSLQDEAHRMLAALLGEIGKS